MTTDHATVAEEEYLQTLYWLQEARLPMTGANVARAMQLSPPTVHEMIGRLERDGYVTRATDKTLSFTDHGREHATAIVRRHGLEISDRAGGQPDRRAPVGELVCERTTDAAGGPGDKRSRARADPHGGDASSDSHTGTSRCRYHRPR